MLRTALPLFSSESHSLIYCASFNTFLRLHCTAYTLSPGPVENLTHFTAFLRNEPLLLFVPGSEILNSTGQDTRVTTVVIRFSLQIHL